MGKIHVTYPVAGGASKKVLSGIDLTVQADDFVSLVGRTGCGKSTLLRPVLGAEMPTDGRCSSVDAKCSGPIRK